MGPAKKWADVPWEAFGHWLSKVELDAICDEDLAKLQEDSRSAEDKMAECKSWHLDRGWSDIGYHYLIDRDGTVTEGRPIEKSGAHAK